MNETLVGVAVEQIEKQIRYILGFVMRNSSNLYDLADMMPSDYSICRGHYQRSERRLLACLGVSAMPLILGTLSALWICRQVSSVDRLDVRRTGEIVSCVGEMLSEYSPDLWWSYLEVLFLHYLGTTYCPLLRMVCAYFLPTYGVA